MQIWYDAFSFYYREDLLKPPDEPTSYYPHRDGFSEYKNFDNYVIFYIPDKTKKLVTVIRVMYSGRDVDKQLDEFTKL